MEWRWSRDGVAYRGTENAGRKRDGGVAMKEKRRRKKCVGASAVEVRRRKRSVSGRGSPGVEKCRRSRIAGERKVSAVEDCRRQKSLGGQGTPAKAFDIQTYGRGEIPSIFGVSGTDTDPAPVIAPVISVNTVNWIVHRCECH